MRIEGLLANPRLHPMRNFRARRSLAKGRKELEPIRDGFVDASFVTLVAVLYKNEWLYRPLFSRFDELSKKQAEVVADHVIKPKRTLGLPIVNEKVERRAKNRGGKHARDTFGIPAEFGRRVVAGQIAITKKQQRQEIPQLWRVTSKKNLLRPKKALNEQSAVVA